MKPVAKSEYPSYTYSWFYGFQCGYFHIGNHDIFIDRVNLARNKSLLEFDSSLHSHAELHDSDDE